MPNTTPTPPEQAADIADAGGFVADAPRAAAEVRDAFAALLRALDVTDRGAGLARALKIDRKLAWRAACLARDQEADAIAQHLPGPEGLEILLSAAERAGVSARTRAAIRRSAARFVSVLSAHAGDHDRRERAGVMLAGVNASGQPGERALMAQRRAAVSAMAAQVGVHARLITRTDILWPSTVLDEHGRPLIDIVAVRGFFGLARLRDSVRWMIGRSKLSTVTGQDQTLRLGPIDPEAMARYGAPLVPEGCTAPMPTVHNLGSESHRPGATVGNFVAGWPVGYSSPASVVVAEWAEGVGRSTVGPGSPYGELYFRHYTPADVLVQDVLIHRDLLGPGIVPGWSRIEGEGESGGPTFHLFSDMGLWPAYPEQAELRQRMPLFPDERVVYRGRGLASAALEPAHVSGDGADLAARHARVLSRVCHVRGMDASLLDVYRVTIAFAPMPTTLAVRVPLRPAGDA